MKKSLTFIFLALLFAVSIVACAGSETQSPVEPVTIQMKKGVSQQFSNDDGHTAEITWNGENNWTCELKESSADSKPSNCYQNYAIAGNTARFFDGMNKVAEEGSAPGSIILSQGWR